MGTSRLAEAETWLGSRFVRKLELNTNSHSYLAFNGPDPGREADLLLLLKWWPNKRDALLFEMRIIVITASPHIGPKLILGSQLLQLLLTPLGVLLAKVVL
jgi:hypothetical protein